MIKKILPALFVYCLLLSQDAQAQTLKAFITAAENAVVSKDYYSALMYYNNALEFDESNIDLQYKSAEASRLFNAYTKAEERYETVIDLDQENKYPMAPFWLGEIKQKKGKYSEAKYLYELYLSESEPDEYFTQRTEKELAAVEWAIEASKNRDSTVTLEHLGDGINSPYSEFAGVYREEELYFSSLRYEKKDDVYNPNRLVSKILKSEDQTTGDLLDASFADGEQHIAHSTFNASGTRMYYTVCEYRNTSEIQCNIYYKNIDADGNYGEGVMLPGNINGDDFTSSQPAIGNHLNEDSEILFFVSDRNGGVGKLDVWYTEVNGDSFSDPTNVESINTIEDDITPFYHSPSSVLYFSSEGYKTLGGFDIFKSYHREDGFSVGEHLPMPLNSSYNDIYYSVNDEGNKAHLSSNREGSYYLDTSQEACCYDIYKADYADIQLQLDAQTFDMLFLTELDGVKVTLKDKNTGEIIGELVDEDGNHHVFDLEREKDYIIIAEKEGYGSEEIELSTKGITSSEMIIKKIYLGLDEGDNNSGDAGIGGNNGNGVTDGNTGLTSLKVLTYDGVTSEKLDGARVRLVDTSTGRIVGEEIYSADSNEFEFQLEPCKKYKLIASRDGYTQAVSYFTADCDGKPMEKKLFLGSGAGIYLPLTLYFDNDIPDLRSIKTYTDKTYTSTYDPYIVKKEEFKDKYSKPLSGEEKNRAKQNVDEFFEFDVKGGYGQLTAFLGQLESELISGRKIQISIKGYASPRASSKYNMALSKRRIHSLKNELVKYKDGVLADYIVSEQLKVVDLPFGESQSVSGISDQIPDRRNSIYSVEASRERRIEILGLNYLD